VGQYSIGANKWNQRLPLLDVVEAFE